MPELTLKRIPFTETADQQLRTLKARTGMPANILCRLGFCLSLEEPGLPPQLPKGFPVGREINRYTLLGEYDGLFIALLVIRMAQDKQPESHITEKFLDHMVRGVALIKMRITSCEALESLCPKSCL